MSQLAEELREFTELNPYDQISRIYEERQSPLASLVTKISLVAVGRGFYPDFSYRLATGMRDISRSYNPLVRATSGFGAQGEGHVNLDGVVEVSKLLGIPLDNVYTIPEQGHFAISNEFKASRNVRHIDPSIGIEYNLRYTHQNALEVEPKN